MLPYWITLLLYVYRLQGNTTAQGFYAKANYHIHTRLYILLHQWAFGTIKQLGFPLLVGMPLKPKVWLFFLMRELCCSSSKMMRE